MFDFELRPLEESDKSEYADLVHSSFNAWYWKKGWGMDYFRCPPEDAAVFYDIYNDLSPACSIAAINKKTKRMMGACFYHPREYHVSLGIMSVHPSYGGRGIGKALVKYIIDFTRSKGYKSLRLVGSAINMDSFSLYNKSGFVPRKTYHDMVISVPADGIRGKVRGLDMVRDATIGDAHSMGELEFELSGIKRLQDYLYAIENKRGLFQVKVIETTQGCLDGFMISIKHPALNMIGPGVARTEEAAAALILSSLERYKGEGVLSVIPMDCCKLVSQMYEWKARNVETHLYQVWGEFQPFKGISIPSFLPETG
ncbi:MAG: GNAT family N-acetyltransferase [Deltaproteobacteria bacterium]|nr:GNAT family N-acetyltransferase [Deltaproteobacteria bacterium]